MSAEARRRRHRDRARAREAGVSLATLRLADEAAEMLHQEAHPLMVLTVSGGTLSPDSAKRIREYLEQATRGKDNFHKVLVLEAGHRVELGDGRMHVTVGGAP